MKTYNKITRDITFASALIAIFTILRIALYPMIGGNPTLVIIILISAFTSRRIALFSGIGLYILTGILFGFGIWVFFQIIAILLIIIIASLIPKNKLIFYIFAVISAFLYSFIMLFSALPYISLQALPAYIFAGLPTDFARAATNLIYMIILYNNRFITLMRKYYN